MSGIGDYMDRKRRFPTEAFYGLERAQFAQSSFWLVGFGPDSSDSELRPTMHMHLNFETHAEVELLLGLVGFRSYGAKIDGNVDIPSRWESIVRKSIEWVGT